MPLPGSVFDRPALMERTHESQMTGRESNNPDNGRCIFSPFADNPENNVVLAPQCLPERMVAGRFELRACTNL